MLQHPLSGSSSSTLHSLHVLIVDDDAFMLQVVVGMLKGLGVTKVTTGRDGEHGIAQISQCAAPPDLIITDLNMPGKDGFQLMEYLAAQHFAGRVALLSGMDDRTRNSAALMGRFHHLNVIGVYTKPLSRADLSEMLREANAGGAGHA